MKRSGAVFILLLFGLPPALLPAPSSTEDRQDDDSRKLRDELVKARLENLTLKLRLARLSSQPDEERKVLDDALDADLPEVVAAAFRELSALPRCSGDSAPLATRSASTR